MRPPPVWTQYSILKPSGNNRSMTFLPLLFDTAIYVSVTVCHIHAQNFFPLTLAFSHRTKTLPPDIRQPYRISVIAVKPRITNRAFHVSSDNDFWLRYRISYDANNYRVLMSLRSVSAPLFLSFVLSVACFIGCLFSNKKKALKNWHLTITIGAMNRLRLSPPFIRWVVKIHFFAFDSKKKPHNPLANFPELPQYYNIFLNHQIWKLSLFQITTIYLIN